MLTLFTTPKPMRGLVAITQRNALASWSKLPGCETLVFGDDAGAAELAAEVGARHAPRVARNEHGTPLISDLFAQAERLSQRDLLAYVNADIILMSDFLKAVETTLETLRCANAPRFLMVGRRCDVDLDSAWNFGSGNWEDSLRQFAREHGVLHDHWGIDYLVYRRGTWGEIPPFAVGRPAWDNWMIYRAWELGVPIVDATEVVLAVHQNHDYTHVGLHMDRKAVWANAESRRNLKLAGICGKYQFSIFNATHRLTREGLLPATDEGYLRQRLASLPAYWPRIEFLARVYLKALRLAERLLPPARWRALVLASTPARSRLSL